MRRRLVATSVGIPLVLVLGAVALLGVEAQLARMREYVDDPNFDIDETLPGAGPVIELAVLGDSTAAGLGVDRVDDTLAVQVAAQVAERTGRSVHVVGYGVSGALTSEVVDQQLSKVERADVIVVEVGSNDVTHRTGLDDLRSDTRRLLQGARRRAGVVVLGSSGRLDTPNFHRPLRDLLMWRARAVRRLQERVASSFDPDHVGFVDIGGAVGDEYARTKGANSSDGFHPAAPGYAVWSRALGREVAERL